jgi:hypothetical protein
MALSNLGLVLQEMRRNGLASQLSRAKRLGLDRQPESEAQLHDNCCYKSRCQRCGPGLTPTIAPRRRFEHDFAGTVRQAPRASSGLPNGPYQELFLPVRLGCTPWPLLSQRYTKACTYAVLVGQSSCASSRSHLP